MIIFKFIKDTYSKTYQILTSSEKKEFNRVIFIALVGSILELAGISLLIPLVKVYTDFYQLLNNNLFYSIYEFSGSPTRELFFSYVMMLFVGYFLFKNSFLYFSLNKQYEFVFKVRGNLSVRLYKKYLYMPWTHHIKRNSGNMINMISNEINVFTGSVLLSSVVLISEAIMSSVLFLFLLFYSPAITLLSGLVMIVTVIVLIVVLKNRLHDLGIKRHYYEGMRIQKMQQGLSSIKELLVMSRQDFFLEQYKPYSLDSAKVVKKINLLQALPKYVLEFSIILTVSVVVIYVMATNVVSDKILPMVTVFAVASIRLLPSVTKATGAIQSIRAAIQSLYKISDDLNHSDSQFLQKKSYRPMNFNSEIEFSYVSYAYPESNKSFIKKLNFRIKKYECVGIKGKSGSGKSTLVDLMLGIILPDSGSILVDGKNVNNCMQSWQGKVGFVPQSIYLLDDTIKNNIIFGDKNIDEELLLKSVRDSNLEDFINSLDMGLEESVGERGVRLSGGQRQRIGIARALYQNPELIILDEATSALDAITEQEIANTIKSLKGVKTIIIIAHRLNTLDVCDRVLQMDDGNLI